MELCGMAWHGMKERERDWARDGEEWRLFVKIQLVICRGCHVRNTHYEEQEYAMEALSS